MISEWYTPKAARYLERLIPIVLNGAVQCDRYSAYDSLDSKKVIVLTSWELLF